MNRRRAISAALFCCIGVILMSSCSAPSADRPRPSRSQITATGTCRTFGATTRAVGAARLSKASPVALLANVQVQASSCVDEVAFLFRGGLPGWTVGYQKGTLFADPSGKPVRVGGSVHLVVRFVPASAVDLTKSMPAVSYGGPIVLHPRAPSGIVAVHRLGDFESVMTWAIGINASARFEVLRRGSQLVVRLSRPTPRATRCRSADPSFVVNYPPSWYTELSDQWACQFFNPAPFVIQPASDVFSWAATVTRAQESATRVIQQMRSSKDTLVMSSARVAGLPATIVDVTTSGFGQYPAGYRYRVYVVAAGTRALLVQGSVTRPGQGLATSRAALNRLAAGISRA